ncbi:hypothetical protein [Micavibrio aeruginosavorus]|uniref:hypothetical protein n=1 Tax=Micavibrio aeruginosavorus TaxID=349221 RepID=UPI003F4AD3E8
MIKNLVGVFVLAGLVGVTNAAAAEEPSNTFMSICKARIQYDDETNKYTHEVLEDLVKQGFPRADVEAMEDKARDMVTTGLCELEHQEATKNQTDKYEGNFLSCTFGEYASDETTRIAKAKINEMVRKGTISAGQVNDVAADVQSDAVREVCTKMGYSPK